MSLRFKLIFLISLLFITAIGNSLFTFQLKTNEDDKLIWVNHTHEVIFQSERLLSSLKDTETGQRGFLLTDDSAYLNPYHAGLSIAKDTLEKLKVLTTDNHQQQIRLEKIEEMMNLKFTELAKTIKLLHNDGNISEALKLVKENNGKHYMDNIRSLLSKFENEEMILLEQRKGDFKASRAQIDILVIVQLIIFIFLAIFTFLFLNKNLFQPLNLLLSSTKKTEEGKPLDYTDIVSHDEMGYLLSRFFTMSETIHIRTKVLDHKAHHDGLTGLKNRSKMDIEIENAINESTESNTKLALFFIDLNDFKVLNDTLGHDAGDAILKETAVRLKAAVRSDDSVFRVGGDEFVVLIKHIKTLVEVESIAEKILKATGLPVMIQGQPTKISLSIGIAISPDDSENSIEIVKFSDIAMYEAKGYKDTHYKFFNRNMLNRAPDV